LKIQSLLSEKFPGLRVQEMVCSDVVVQKNAKDLEIFKKSKQSEIRKKIPSLEVVKDLPIIRAYRDFYWKVGIDPTKTRPAGEALVRRILSGKDLPTINTLVDSYNLASAESMVSIAAFDDRKVDRGNLFMRIAVRGETFVGIGMTNPMELSGVEVVIEDITQKKLIAVYPYRDADESKVSEETEDVLFMMCGVPGIREEDLDLAKDTAMNYVSKFCSK